MLLRAAPPLYPPVCGYVEAVTWAKRKLMDFCLGEVIEHVDRRVLLWQVATVRELSTGLHDSILPGSHDAVLL